MEVAAKWNARDWWRLNAGFTYLDLNITLDPSSNSNASIGIEGKNPEFQWNLGSNVDLPHNLEFDTNLFWVDSLHELDVPSYLRMDLRLGWRPMESLEISIIGQNLLDPEHPEFNSEAIELFSINQVERSVFVRVDWKF